jgi:hypothetical protein
VQSRIADLIDDQIVLAAGDAPDEVVGALDADVTGARRGVVRARDRHASFVDKDVDRVTASAEERDELGRSSRDAALLRRPGREPGEFHPGDQCRRNSDPEPHGCVVGGCTSDLFGFRSRPFATQPGGEEWVTR